MKNLFKYLNVFVVTINCIFFLPTTNAGNLNIINGVMYFNPLELNKLNLEPQQYQYPAVIHRTTDLIINFDTTKGHHHNDILETLRDNPINFELFTNIFWGLVAAGRANHETYINYMELAARENMFDEIQRAAEDALERRVENFVLIGNVYLRLLGEARVTNINTANTAQDFYRHMQEMGLVNAETYLIYMQTLHENYGSAEQTEQAEEALDNAIEFFGGDIQFFNTNAPNILETIIFCYMDIMLKNGRLDLAIARYGNPSFYVKLLGQRGADFSRLPFGIVLITLHTLFSSMTSVGDTFTIFITRTTGDEENITRKAVNTFVHFVNAISIIKVTVNDRGESIVLQLENPYDSEKLLNKHIIYN